MNNTTESTVVRGGTVVLPNGENRQCDLLLEDGVIAQIGDNLSGTTMIDAKGAYVIPGFVELHTHGIGFISTEASTLCEFTEAMAARGATRFYPTLFGPPQRTLCLLERHRRETHELQDCPTIAGFRLESPYLAGTGAGLPDNLASIADDLTKQLLAAGGGHIKIWDVSPDLPGAAETIRALTRKGIVCSIAHTNATIDQARAAVDAGIKMVTHLYDTFSVPASTDPGVYPVSLIDYLLLEDRVICEIIADGTHAHPLLVQKALRCKQLARVAFVTDGNYGAGLPDGDYTLPAGWGRVRINGCNNGVRLIDREMGLAGSALTPIDLFRNAVRLFGLSLGDAVQLCSANAAELMGLNTGAISIGKDADLLLLDADLTLRMTIARGTPIFSTQSVS